VIIGIDLGTTHCGVACTSGDAVEPFAIPQLAAAAEVRPEPLLPSFLYVPAENERQRLPDLGSRLVAGRYAQVRGTETLGRLIASAKSWLSYAGVDRTSALLPLNAPDGVEKLSPVAASAEYLAHIRRRWDEANPDRPMSAQTVVITVPASFDEVARELTLEAARVAEYPPVTLLEEPQAALYAWLERHRQEAGGADWREQVSAGDVILVADIGGGTTDFSLIAVTEKSGRLELERIAVGDHILLGGDNMDLALARRVAERMPKLDALQFQALWQQCRQAKERLLDPESPMEEQPVTVLGRGSGLVAGMLKGTVSRTEALETILEGFFPAVPADERPQRARRAALAEVGLPYAADVRVTAHLAEFLARAGRTPTHVLFNGGVLRAAAIRERLLSQLDAKVLDGENLMHAVARGAAYFGLVRQGKGIRIRGGLSRTYYVGIETALPAVPGMPPPLKALAVAPFGLEEGSEAPLPGREFVLSVGQTAEFRILSSSRHDAAGVLLDEIPPELAEMPPMEVALAGEPGLVRVTLESRVTDTGMLELWCVSRDGRRWKLEFNTRERVP
jgi:molecular chaperone DnaK (HSP70)